jgi:hypothetical protein
VIVYNLGVLFCFLRDKVLIGDAKTDVYYENCSHWIDCFLGEDEYFCLNFSVLFRINILRIINRIMHKIYQYPHY